MPFHGLRYTLPALLLVSSLQAQTTNPASHPTRYWVTAGAGVANIWNDKYWLGTAGSSLALAASVQRGALVGTVRSTRSSSNGLAAWDAGVIIGAGTSPRYAMRGSIGAGLGLAVDSRGRTGLALPLELQLGWRLARSIGISTYGFGSVGGPTQYFGVAAGFQIGRLN